MNTALYLRLVSDFHRAMLHRQPEPVAPDLEDIATNALRPELIREEIHELRTAIRANDRVEILDALCDIQYVLSGSVIDWGFRPMFENSPCTVVLRKIPDIDARLAGLLGLVGITKVAAEFGFASQVFTNLRELQSRLSGMVFHFGLSPVFDEAFKTVHANNLGKIWSDADMAQCDPENDGGNIRFTASPAGGWIARRGDGKILKPVGFSKVTLERFV